MMGSNSVIYKYSLQVVKKQVISLPDDFNFLSLQVQRNEPKIWLKVTKDNPFKVNATFYTFSTGNELTELPIFASFLGTYQLHGGDSVFHVWIDVNDK